MSSGLVRLLAKTIASLLMLVLAAQASEPQLAPPYARPDDRYKTDILLILAHPDDETGDVAGYLARAIFDEHRRVSVIYTTRGEGGKSAVGNERGNALGAVREIEARRALGLFGVTDVWFLGAPDTGGSVLRSLESMDHGSILARVVRLVRLTRPEVIITWLPMPVAGENHGDHQAASVIANEAFDLAGDPTVFAEQTSGEQDSLPGRGDNPEGLHAWQTKKIYYFSDAYDEPGYWWQSPPLPSPYRRNFLDGAGPAYSNTEVSSAKGVTYARLSAQELSFYATQDGEIGREALRRGDFKAFESPTHFVLGKSLVGGTTIGDVFEGVTAGPIAFVRPPGYQPGTGSGISLRMGGPWQFYHEFWKAHASGRLTELLSVPEVSIRPGQSLDIPLIIHNDTDTVQDVRVTGVLPGGWVEKASFSRFPLPANSAYPIERLLTAPAAVKAGWYEVKWAAKTGGREIDSVVLRVYAAG